MVNWKFNTILKNSILYFLVSEPTRLPNIGYLGGGYDIYKGNPREIGSVDPGFRLEPIFNLTLDGGITPDGRYILPKGVVAELCISCVIDFSTDYVKNIHDYRKELDKSISGSASSFFGKFSASRSYKDVYKKTEEQEKKFTMNEANCALYCMKGLTFLPRELSDDFKVAVELLSNNSDDPIYYEFINAFGTHYVHSMKMGSNFGVLTEFTKSSWEEMNSKQIDVSVAASTSAFIKAGIDVKNGEKNELAKKFESYSEKSHIHSTGASLPSTGEMKDWIPRAFENPMPQTYELNNVYDLLNSRYFSNDKDIDMKRKTLKEAIDKYCLRLKDQGLAITCSEDHKPQLPEPKILTMYNCPATSYDFWVSNGCIDQLSTVDNCQDTRLQSAKIFQQYLLTLTSTYTSAIYSCPKVDVDLFRTAVYACPVVTEGSGEHYTSCLGQLTLKRSQCENWGHPQRNFACERFDVSKRTIYKCPFNPYIDASHDVVTIAIGCVGQYSHINKCYNQWIQWGAARRTYFNCEVYHWSNQEFIKNEKEGKLSKTSVGEHGQQESSLLLGNRQHRFKLVRSQNKLEKFQERFSAQIEIPPK